MVTEESHHQRWLAAIQSLLYLQGTNKTVLKRRVKRVLAKHEIETNDYRVDLTIDLAKAASLLDEYGFGIVSMKPR
jgi:hypothetical protein